MLLEIIWNGEATPADLADGTVTVGGDPNDHICIAGLPAGLVTLTIGADGVVVSSSRSVRIGAALFPARVPRLLIDGEDMQLPNDVVLRKVADPKRRESRRNMGTAFVAKELLAGDFAVEQTRAATFTCVTGNDQGITWPIAFSESIIGRADDADLRVRDRAVSRQHAKVVREGKRWWLVESSSTNGVFLNGVKVRGRREMKNGDLVELGQTVLRFEASERAPEEATFVEPQPPTQPAALAAPVLEPSTPPAPPLDALRLSPEPLGISAEPTQPMPARQLSPLLLSAWFIPAMMCVGALLALGSAAVTLLVLKT